MSEASFARAMLVTRPLSQFMNRVSLLEVAQNRIKLRRMGLSLPDSRCSSDRADVIQMNKDLLTGATGWQVVAGYQALLEAPSHDQVWDAGAGLNKSECINLLLLGICDAWRRLVLTLDALPFQLFQLIEGSESDALRAAETLIRRHGPCDQCCDPLCSKVTWLVQVLTIGDRVVLVSSLFQLGISPKQTWLDCQVFLGWVLADGISEEVKVKRMTRLRLVLADVLLELPASTVEVERSHANLQTDASPHKHNPKRPSNVQLDSYIMAAVLEHNQLSQQVEHEVFKEGKGRVQRVLRSRSIESAAPGNGLRMGRPNLNDDGTVRRRKGLLKGLLQAP